MQSNSIQMRLASGAAGAEITGVDLSKPLAAQARDTIRRTLADRGVVFFRDQSLTPEQHIGLARQFGEINVNRFFAHVDGYPEIALVVKEPEHKKNIGGGWHTDHSYDQSPALGSILYARQVPASGGDTLFASMYAAYDALSEGLKQTLGGLRAVHSSRHVFGMVREDFKDRFRNPEAAVQDAVHPVVITTRRAAARRCM